MGTTGFFITTGRKEMKTYYTLERIVEETIINFSLIMNLGDLMLWSLFVYL